MIEGFVRYFTYIADQAFYALPTGDLLFYRNGLWSRPYVISDIETARRLYKKYVWLLRLIFGGFLVGNPVLLSYFPGFMDRPYILLLYIAAYAAIYWLADKIVLSRDCAALKRLENPLSRTELDIQTAWRHNKLQIILACIFSVACFSIGVWMTLKGEVIFGLLSILCFMLCGFSWFRILYQKLRLHI